MYHSTHTKPGHSKANKSLSVSEYTKLLQIAAEARKLVIAHNARLGNTRVFTEPRKGGLRTKLWGSGLVKTQDIIAIQDMLTKRFPQYTIRVDFSTAYMWALQSLSIYITVKPIIAEPKAAVVAEKPKARLTGSTLIMRNAIVEVATIPAGTLSIESQFHISVGSMEFELVDSWLVLNDDMVNYKESEKYHNYLEMHLGRSMEAIYKDAAAAAEEVVRKAIVLHDSKLIIR
tara:strand:- start:409 stop:1101 length:693 start_codon:yes stop_codon:yes gene_type:complete